MNRKIQAYNLINLIGVFLAVSRLMKIKNTDYIDYFGIIVFAIILLLIGNIVYVYSYKDKAIKYFLLMMYITSWILLVPNTTFSLALIIFAPAILFSFLGAFFYLDKKISYPILKYVMILICIINASNLFWFNDYLFVLFLVLSFTYIIIIYIYLSIKYKNYQRKSTRLYQLELICAAILALLPFIIAITIVPQEYNWAYPAFYFFLILPLFIGYVQIKRNSLLTKFSWRNLLIIVSSVIIGLIVYFIIGHFILNLNKNQIILMLILFAIIASIIFLIYQNISVKEWNEAYTTMQTYEQERLELLQIKIYDSYLSTFKFLVEKIFELLPIIDGIIFSLTEEQEISVLHRTGIFTKNDLNLNKIDYRKSSVVINNFHLEIHRLQTSDDKLIGYIITHTNNNSKLSESENYLGFTQLLKGMANLLSQSHSLRKYQKKYLMLPAVMQEKSLLNHYNEELTRTKHDVAKYLHDEILQSLFAIKKYVEILKTKDIELKEVVLKQITFLNDILRNEMNDLYPLSLLDVSFYQNIVILIEQLRNKNLQNKEINFIINCDDLENLELNTLQLLYRIIKELTQNALKHANAKNVHIDIILVDEKFIQLIVKDDGVGLILENIENSNKFGLLSVKHSVNVLNGTIKINSTKENGTEIKIVFPVEREVKNESSSL